LEKFTDTRCSPIRQQLGMVINTNTMCICIPKSKLDALQALMTSKFHEHRKQITVLEGATLLGNLDHLASNIPWFRHTYLSIRLVFNNAISHLYRAVEDSDHYIRLLGQSDTMSGNHLTHHHRFLSKWLASQVYSNKHEKINLNVPFQNDLALLRSLTSRQSLWVTPIPHIIPRTPTFVAYCDSCLTGAGGYSPNLHFCWSWPWPNHTSQDSTLDALLGDQTHINILEYLAILITYAIAQRCLRDNPTLAPDSYPTILIHSDNTTAVSWAQTTISSSDPVAKHAARLACLLQVNARLGLKVAYIEGDNNGVSDTLSRLYCNPDSPLFVLPDQFHLLQDTLPQLQSCNHYPLPHNLLSLVMTLFSKHAGKQVLEWSIPNKHSTQESNCTCDGWNLLD